MSKDPYEILGVAPGADPDEIKKAYRRKTKECHPDLHPEDPTAGERMRELNAAYEMLQNPEKYEAEKRREQAQRQYSQQAQQGYGQYSQNGYTYYTYTYNPFEGFEEEDGENPFYGFRNQQPTTFRIFPIFSIFRWIFYLNAIGWFLRLLAGLFLR